MNNFSRLQSVILLRLKELLACIIKNTGIAVYSIFEWQKDLFILMLVISSSLHLSFALQLLECVTAMV